MARDVADVLGDAIGRAAREAARNISANSGKRNGLSDRVSNMVSGRMDGLSGSKGLAAGVGAATLVPLAAKGAGKLVRGITGNGGSSSKPSKAAKALKGGGGKSDAVPGVGKGRRMPVQQDIDIGAPIDMVWKEWTNFEEWPTFMHRLQNVSQEDDKHVTFKTKIWGVSKDFRAEIVEQRENERIKWQVTDGVTHTGVVSFHELGPRLTRMEVNLDVEPGSLIEKAARGMRHVKRAVRSDMARFKAYVLMQEQKPAGRSSSSSRASASSSPSRSSGSSSGSRKRSTSSARKQSSNGGQRRRSSSSARTTRASSSSNGRSRSRSSASKKRTGSRS